MIAIVTAETLGLPLEAVKVNIGDNKYPPAGASGGSTTVSGVSTSTRRAATEALNTLLAKVAPSVGAAADQLEAWDGKIQVKGDAAKSISWKQACAKLGTSSITGIGKTSIDLMSMRRWRTDGRSRSRHRNGHRENRQTRFGAGLRPGD